MGLSSLISPHHAGEFHPANAILPARLASQVLYPILTAGREDWKDTGQICCGGGWRARTGWKKEYEDVMVLLTTPYKESSTN